MPVSNPQKSVSAIVVTYDSAAHISACLKALTSEIDAVGGEVVVFDNNSGDATLRAVESGFPDVKIIRSDNNIGFAAANNNAAAESQGEYLLLVNPDLALDSGSLAKMLAVFDEHDDAGAVAGRMRNPDGTFQPTCRNLPTMKNIFFSRGSMLGGKGGSNKYTLGDFDSPTPVPAAAATCLLLRRDFFLELGGFDERFFMFMEDTDLSRRIGETGKKIYFIPDAGGVHHWGGGSAVSKITRLRYHHMSVWKYFLKHYPNGFSLLLLPIALLANFFLRAVFGRQGTD